jgi:hypothetical protein
MNAIRWLPGMLGCIDYMHLRWKNYLATWHGQFTGHVKDPNIILRTLQTRRHGFGMHISVSLELDLI